MPLVCFAGGGGRASPRIHVPGARAHPPSVKTFVHLTNIHYGAVLLLSKSRAGVGAQPSPTHVWCLLVGMLVSKLETQLMVSKDPSHLSTHLTCPGQPLECVLVDKFLGCLFSSLSEIGWHTPTCQQQTYGQRTGCYVPQSIHSMWPPWYIGMCPCT
jgi:hypothetical protein